MSEPKELPDDDYAQITRLSAEGDALAEQGAFEHAISKYNEAWLLVPEPKHEWDASTWLLVAIGDAAFLGEFYGTAKDAFQYAVLCPNGLGNPFIHLRLGETLYEKEEFDKAADELMRAYMGAGEDIFANEDPKYRAFLATRANLD